LVCTTWARHLDVMPDATLAQASLRRDIGHVETVYSWLMR